MTAMMIDGGKRVAAGGARFQWHMIPIADIDLIARNTGGKENGVASSLRGRSLSSFPLLVLSGLIFDPRFHSFLQQV
jgi:hypothetical protein